ncbi:MAG: SHOCT domain-containing protein [Candidatus Pelagibacter sp.]|jgi:uncharacterized membrane protein|tara:strand:+ start:703 stop:942 length:240 start_codon:yes stop_codon:yes gene_type:complete
MTTYFLYISVLCIFIFVLFIAFRAIKQGMDAKSENSQEDNEYPLNKSMSEELEKISKLYENGSLSEDEYKKAKEKILNE